MDEYKIGSALEGISMDTGNIVTRLDELEQIRKSLEHLEQINFTLGNLAKSMTQIAEIMKKSDLISYLSRGAKNEQQK